MNKTMCAYARKEKYNAQFRRLRAERDTLAERDKLGRTAPQTVSVNRGSQSCHRSIHDLREVGDVNVLPGFRNSSLQCLRKRATQCHWTGK